MQDLLNEKPSPSSSKGEAREGKSAKAVSKGGLDK
jgi:hypothetical protein